MAADELDPQLALLLTGLRRLQDEFGAAPVADIVVESPRAALTSLEDAVSKAPGDFRAYLQEAVECYSQGLFRPAILMVWAAAMQHLYMRAAGHSGGVRAFEKANFARFGGSKNYRRIKKQDDFLYLRDRDFLQLAEDAGMLNRNARRMLHERLDLRNDCGHPTKYVPGREQTVIFIESLLLNVIAGAQLNW